jgi:Domain of unknown function (DUF4190)
VEEQPAAPAPISVAPVQPMTVRTDGLAIAALVVGLLAPFADLFDGVPGVIFGAAAVTLGLVSRRRIKRSGGTLAGRGLALAGIIVGAFAIVAGLLIAVLFIGLFMAMQSGAGKP